MSNLGACAKFNVTARKDHPSTTSNRSPVSLSPKKPASAVRLDSFQDPCFAAGVFRPRSSSGACGRRDQDRRTRRRSAWGSEYARASPRWKTERPTEPPIPRTSQRKRPAVYGRAVQQIPQATFNTERTGGPAATGGDSVKSHGRHRPARIERALQLLARAHAAASDRATCPARST